MTREDVNGNKPFPGVLPAATFGFKRVALNLTYMPESVVDRVTNSKKYDPSMEGVFFLQLKLDASLFGFGRRNGQWLAQRARRIAPAAPRRRSRRPALLVCYRWANCESRRRALTPTIHRRGTIDEAPSVDSDCDSSGPVDQHRGASRIPGFRKGESGDKLEWNGCR